jgi:acylphosphatase
VIRSRPCGLDHRRLDIREVNTDNSSETGRAHVKITGRVQGVYYRASMLQEAQKLGLTGWVMNCPDGSVEAIAEGSRGKIEQLIAWCQCGPPGARVTDVDVRWETPEHAFRGFAIAR